MGKINILLKMVGMYGLRYGLNAAGVGVLPIGDLIMDGVDEVWQECRREREDHEIHDAVEKAAQANMQEFRSEVAQIIREIAGNREEKIQQQLQSYLTQVQAMIRRAQRRPSDPTGTTLQKNLVFKQAQDLIPFIPTRMARFQPGDFPLPGVDWQLNELLGFGGFGEVWRASNPDYTTIEPVALKFCLDTVARESLKREANILSRVMKEGKHPGIVQLKHTYSRSDTPCLEYEFIDGGDLTGLIHERYREQGGIPPDEASEIIAQIAEIVGFAHDLHPPIVHRDLKPANILVQLHGKDRFQFKITDFGLGGIAAQQVVAASKGFSLGQIFSNSLLGSHTPLYASPQQMAGSRPEPQDDVYSLGVIWYQLLTGNLSEGAPTGDGWKEDLSRHGMPSDRISCLSRCIETSVERRFPNAKELYESIVSAREIGSKKTSIHIDAIKTHRTAEEYAEELRNSKEAWSFAEKHQGKPGTTDIQNYINDLTDLGIVGGGKLTRSQAEMAILYVCGEWIVADEKRRERETWEQIKRADTSYSRVETKKSYENLVTAFPRGAHRVEAHKRIQEIDAILKEEDRLWQKAIQENTSASCQVYLHKFAIGGRYLQEAQQKKSMLEGEEEKQRLEKELWQEAIQKNSIESYQKYLQDSPFKHRKEEAENKIWELMDPKLKEKKLKEEREANIGCGVLAMGTFLLLTLYMYGSISLTMMLLTFPLFLIFFLGTIFGSDGN